jgi:hypothetical protein
MPDSFLWRASKAEELGREFRKSDRADIRKTSTVDPVTLVLIIRSLGSLKNERLQAKGRPVCLHSVLGVFSR